MAEVGVAFVSIVPSAKGFGSKLNSQVGSASTSAGTTGGKKFGGTFSSAAGAAVKGLATVFAVGAVVKGLQSVIAEAREAQKVGATTAQIIKSTGGAANVSAGQVAKLAESISLNVGVDDELIQRGANLLLTFKNVRNEAGKNNKVFDQATKAAVDLSAAGFGSVESASKMLGKALNDPVKGMTALGRAGVTFTEGQKKQIEGMVKAGDLLGAQKVILGEVQSQVGGVAAASATAGEKMGVAWANAKEQIGTALLPTLDRIAVFISSKVIPAVLKLGPAFSKIGAFVKPAAEAISNLFSGGGGPGGAQLAKTFQALVTFAKPLLAILVNLGRQAIAILKPAFTEIANIFTTQFLPAFRALLPILQPVAAFLLKIFGGAILGIIKGFVNVVKGALQILTGIFQVFAAIVTGDWDKLWKGLGNILKGAWNVIKGIFQIAINVGIVGVIKKLPAIVWGLFKLLMKGSLALLKAGWNLITSLFKTAMTKARTAVVDGTKKVISDFRALPGKIKSALGNLGSLLLNAGKSIIQGLINGITSKFNALKSKLSSVTSLIPKWKGPPPRDAKLLLNAGELIIGGLIRGMDSKDSALRASLASKTQIIGNLAGSPRFSAGNLATGAGTAPMEFSLVGARVELDKNGFATFVDGRIRINNRQGALQARYATP